MTIDDAREDFMNDVYNTLDFLPTNNEANRIIDSFDRVTSGLDQQPCEDCISREAVLDALHLEGRPTKRFDYFIAVKKDIMSLPPVTPKEKTGKWIDDKCSACGKGIENLIASSEWYRNENPKYCPFCGIKILSYNVEKEK